jgi:DNA-binding response OmpR family regulator
MNYYSDDIEHPPSTTNNETDDSNLVAEFNREHLGIHYVTLNDSSRSLREEWMKRTFAAFEEFEYSENDTRFLSSVAGDYAVLLVGANDPVRAGSVIRPNRPILNNKIKICLMNQSNSHKRARALSYGFDDAIEISRVAPAEALARILAIHRRQQVTFDQAERQRDFETRLREYCSLGDLTPRQRQAAEILFRHKGRIVSYQSLTSEIGSHFRREITPANLKVIICKLRKNLNDGAQIISVPRSGYQMLIDTRRAPVTPA